jgi:hypothetical protein
MRARGWKILLLAALVPPCLARGDGPAPAAPPVVPAPTESHALLEQMSRESEALYRDVQKGVIRLQLPPPRWLNELAAKDNPVDKWGHQLSGPVRATLEDERKGAQSGRYRMFGTRITPTTQPDHVQQQESGVEEVDPVEPPPGAANSDGPWKIIQDAGSNTTILESRGGAAVQIQTGGAVENGHVAVGGPPVLTLQRSGTFAANNVGLLFDDAGHVLVPIYLEKETVGDGVRASAGAEGPVTNATFVASDRQTNVTILQLPPGTGRPVRLASTKPGDGSLVLLLQPGGGSARLMTWTAGQRDVAGVVVSVDGSVAGFARYGQFLAAASCKPVVEQLVQFGKVKRAVLGLVIREVGRGDPARERWATLGSAPALRVEDVKPGSAAEKAGLRRGDLILRAGDDAVGDPATFGAAISGRSGPICFHLLRSGAETDVTVDLKPE